MLLVEEIFCAVMPEASATQRLAALLHDAPEYVIGDMISPFKSVVGGGYKEVEGRLQRAIHLRFALPAEPSAVLRDAIKRADQIAAYFEATMLAGFSIAEASRYFGRPRGFDASRFDLTSRAPNKVQKSFVTRFNAIERARRVLCRRSRQGYGRSIASRRQGGAMPITNAAICRSHPCLVILGLT